MRKFILFILFMIFVPSLSQGNNLYEAQLDRGIRNTEPYSYLLIQKSKENRAEAKDILREALYYSPDLPAVYFELSKAHFNLSPEGIFEAVDYMIQGIAAYKRNFWWAFMVLASLLISLIISFLISMFVLVTLRLSKDMPLLSHDIKEEKMKVLFLLVLIFAVFGPLYLICGLLFLSSFYMKKWDRIVVYLYIVFLFILPWIFHAVSVGLKAPSSGELKAVVQVNESRGNIYALSVLKDGNEPAELFSYALALKREGGYTEAIDAYKKLALRKPDSRIYNNLANCYVALKDFAQAEKLYKKSISLNPLPSALYNLSQVYRETLDFERGEKYFLAAQQLNREAVSEFRSIFSRSPNRFVIDETLSMADMVQYALGKITTSTLGLTNLPVQITPFVAVFAVLLFFILDRKIKGKAYRCNRCGVILCSKCEKHILWGNMCSQCYRSLIKLDELDAKERIARLLAVYDYRKKKRNRIKIISLIMPGSGQIFAGNTLKGFLFLWPFLFFLCIPVMNSVFDIEMFTHLWLNLVSLLFVVILYLFTNMATRRRLSKGWL